jgi:uncharacterized protein
LRIACVIHTPGQVHFWSHIITTLQENGHNVLVVSRNSEIMSILLTNYGIKSDFYGNNIKALGSKLFHLPEHFLTCFSLLSRFHPDIIVGSGILESHSSALLKKPCVIFEDTEMTPSLERIQWIITTSDIITPSCFMRNLGKKQIRINGYKELAYLHPNYFKPNATIFNQLGIDQNEKYIIVRFNAFSAVHDVGKRGFPFTDKFTLIKTLEKYAKIFISAEGDLPADLEKYRLSISPHKIHQILYHAQMLVSDTGTMTTEAAVLGTPGIMCLSNAAEFGNFLELEQKYGLLFSFYEPQDAISKALELIQQPDLKNQWAQKRQKLLNEKIDVTRFMVDFIENYPESSKKI